MTRQFRFSFPRPGVPAEPAASSWVITFDPKVPLCGYALRKLDDWTPALDWGPVVYHPTIEGARRDLPRGERLLCLEGLNGARLLRVRPLAWGEIREVWF